MLDHGNNTRAGAILSHYKSHPKKAEMDLADMANALPESIAGGPDLLCEISDVDVRQSPDGRYSELLGAYYGFHSGTEPLRMAMHLW